MVAAVPMPAQETAPWPTEGWTEATAEAVGMDPGPIAEVMRGVHSGRYGNVDRVVIVKNGYLVRSTRHQRDYAAAGHGMRSALGCGIEACREGDVHDYNYLHPDIHPYYRGRDVHSLQSVTKSIAATVVGAAIHRGRISGTDAPLTSFFGDYDLDGADPRLHDVTLDDLLTMRSGIEWHEHDRPLDETNTTLQLERSEDWIQFTLDQPMDADPGSRWVYNSGGSHLMSGVVRSATGRHMHDYARDVLFGPLGIDDFYWKTTPRGYADTEGGLYLEAEQLAKIGWLYLQDGVWDGERLLPEGWVAEATARQVESVNPAGWGYGYQWWRIDRNGTDVWAGLGFGGQYLVVLPAHHLVGVVNSWNVFGGRNADILIPFVDALIDSVGG